MCHFLKSKFNYKRIGMLYVVEDFGTSWKNALFAACDALGIRVFSAGFADLQGPALGVSVDQAMEALPKELNVIVAIHLKDETLAWFAKSALKWGRNGPNNGKLWIFSGVDDSTKTSAWSLSKQFNGNVDIMPIKDYLEFFASTLSIGPTIPGLANSLANPAWSRFVSKFKTNLTAAEVNKYLPSYTISFPGGIPSYQIPNDAWFSSNANFGPVAGWTYDAVIAIGIAACNGMVNDTIPSGSDLRTNLRNLDFTGLSGRVKFLDDGDRDPLTAAYTLSNSQRVNVSNHEESPTYKTVGLFNPTSGEWDVDLASMQFPLQASTAPLDVTPPIEDKNLLPIWIKATGYVQVAIVLAFCLICFYFLVSNRRNPIVVNSQPTFMHLLNFGVAISVVSIIPLSLDDVANPEYASPACMAFPYLFGIGMNLCVTSLLVKSYRISIIFNNPKFRRVATTTSKYMVAILIMVCLELALLIAWTVSAPLAFTRQTLFEDGFNNPISSVGTCLGPAPLSGLFVGLIITLHALTIALSTLAAYKIRNVPTQYQESRFTAIAALCMLQVYVISLPAVAATYSSPIGRFLVLSFVVFITCVSIQSAMFIPKVLMKMYGGHYFDVSSVLVKWRYYHFY
jgi:hypothetical protein